MGDGNRCGGEEDEALNDGSEGLGSDIEIVNLFLGWSGRIRCRSDKIWGWFLKDEVTMDGTIATEGGTIEKPGVTIAATF